MLVILTKTYHKWTDFKSADKEYISSAGKYYINVSI